MRDVSRCVPNVSAHIIVRRGEESKEQLGWICHSTVQATVSLDSRHNCRVFVRTRTNRISSICCCCEDQRLLHSSVLSHIRRRRTMGSLLQCLFRICCDAEEERGRDDYYPPNAGFLARQPAQAALISRAHSLDDRGGYHATSGHGDTERVNEGDRHDDDNSINDNNQEEGEPDSDDNGVTDCCHPGSANSKQAAVNNPHARGIQEFFRQIQSRWRRNDSLLQVPMNDEDDDDDTIASTSRAFRSKIGAFPHSPLRAAASFDSTREIPTINAEEFVMPRSLLQKEMAKAMAAKMQNEDDECVICMEGFDPTNPRMPTHCGCGRNRTYFHLPCLYQWVEQSRDCPSCRERLIWEEF
jgi:hypothetical protein